MTTFIFSPQRYINVYDSPSTCRLMLVSSPIQTKIHTNDLCWSWFSHTSWVLDSQNFFFFFTEQRNETSFSTSTILPGFPPVCGKGRSPWISWSPRQSPSSSALWEKEGKYIISEGIFKNIHSSVYLNYKNCESYLSAMSPASVQMALMSAPERSSLDIMYSSTFTSSERVI